MSTVDQAWQAEDHPASFARRAAARIRTALRHRYLPLAAAIVAVVAMLPALSGGWQMDDYFQRCTLLGYGDTKPIQVFEPYPDRQHNLAQMAFGTMPWWGSTEMHQVFCQRRSKSTSPGRSKLASLIDKLEGAAGFGQGVCEGDLPPRTSVELVS